MDMNKNVEMNTAIVSANNTLSTTVQQPAAPAPADTEMIETTFTDDKEQAPAAAPADEKKQEEKKKHRKVEHCRVDFAKNAIVITRDFARRASIVGTPEFKRLSELCNAYPSLTVITRTARKGASKNSTKGLTMAFMENYITHRCPDDVELYKSQVEISKTFKSPYMYLRKWFVEHYSDWAKYVLVPDQKAEA